MSILVVGAGKIGAIIAQLLAQCGDYHVHLADPTVESIAPHLLKSTFLNTTDLDITNADKATAYIKKHGITTIIACTPYFLVTPIATLAKQLDCYYFDLTEDSTSSETIAKMAKTSTKQAFVSQCGLAPGFINIVANELMSHFETLEEGKLRCGALPQHTSNALQYTLNWSTDGLINEYANPCRVIVNSEQEAANPLENLEKIQIDGLNYEAFNTSGGIGSLIDTYTGKINTLNYKSIRYPGHRNKMKFLMQGLKLAEDRDTLKRILENAIPATKQDVVIIYVSAKGEQKGKFISKHYVKKFYPAKIGQVNCNAIQACTACGACAVIDTVLQNTDQYHGHITQEAFALDTIISNRFGCYFAEKIPHF